jgi:D-beta-D-heptose 7-phosphate kinase / D-beta-D-heptose 1-phosphate adenosyltransferase
VNFARTLDSNCNILVVGDVMLDQYFEGHASRISPEAPVPVLKVAVQFNRPGGAANVALNIAALGLKVSLLAYVGRDASADILRQELESLGVTCEFVQAASARTIVKLRALSMRQQMLRMDFEDSFAGEDHEELTQRFSGILSKHDLVVFSDYAKGTLCNVERMIAEANRAQKRCLVDPKGTDFSKYCGAFALTPNFSEFTAVVGDVPTDEMLRFKAEELIRQHTVSSIIITRGERGMALVDGDGALHSIPAEAQEVFDVTGAGDTVIATLAAALSSGFELKDAMRIANTAAAIVVSRKGTTAVSIADLEARIASHSGRSIGPDDALAQITDAQLRGEKIVMTNGCFDILHAGHVSYLQKAKDLGDRLVVAVNSDASVRRLKGSERPINKLQDRLDMLAALKCVDWAIGFDGSVGATGSPDDTPLDIIRQIRPDILVKGGDYQKAGVVGAADVEKSGGRVEILPFVEGHSTTSIANRLKIAS